MDWAKQSVRVNPDALIAHLALAASYAQLGRIEEARTALEEDLRLEPDLTLERLKQRGGQLDLSDNDFIEAFLDGLRKAGLPE